MIKAIHIDWLEKKAYQSERNFFELMDNSLFGETMKNLINRVEVSLLTNSKKWQELISRRGYVSEKTVESNIVAVFEVNELLLFNKIACIGMCIVEFSKVLIYVFHYNYKKKNIVIKTTIFYGYGTFNLWNWQTILHDIAWQSSQKLKKLWCQ